MFIKSGEFVKREEGMELWFLGKFIQDYTAPWVINQFYIIVCVTRDIEKIYSGRLRLYILKMSLVGFQCLGIFLSETFFRLVT